MPCFFWALPHLHEAGSMTHMICALSKTVGVYASRPILELATHHGSMEHLFPMATRSRRRRSEEHTSELQSLTNLVCRLLLEKNYGLLHGVTNKGLTNLIAGYSTMQMFDATGTNKYTY